MVSGDWLTGRNRVGSDPALPRCQICQFKACMFRIGLLAPEQGRPKCVGAGRISTWDTGGPAVEKTHWGLQKPEVWSFQKCSSGWPCSRQPVSPAWKLIGEVRRAVKRAWTRVRTPVFRAMELVRSMTSVIGRCGGLDLGYVHVELLLCT